MTTGAQNWVQGGPRGPFRAKKEFDMAPFWLLLDPLGATMGSKGGQRVPKRGSVRKKGDIVKTIGGNKKKTQCV